MNRLKTLKRRHYGGHVELSEVPPSELETTQDRVLDLNESEAKRLVEQILGRLNEEKRRLVEMVCFDGMTIREVAELTHEPRARIENQYYRTIAELRVKAREAEAPPGLLSKEDSKPGKATRKLSGTLEVDQEEVEIG